MSDALANAGSDVTVAETSFGSQSFTGTGTPGTGGTSITGYAWKVAGVPPGSSVTTASLLNASTSTVTLTPDVVGNYRLFLVVTDNVGNVSEDNPFLAPNAAFVQYRVELTNTGLEKGAPGDRNYAATTHAVVDYLEDTVAPAIAPATTTTLGVVKLKDAPVDAANPKAITQDRVSYCFTKAGKIAASPGSGAPCRAAAWVMVPEDLTLFAVSIAMGDAGTTTRTDYVFGVHRQTYSDWVGNVYGAALETSTWTAPGTSNQPDGINITVSPQIAFAAREVASVRVSSADSDAADQGSDMVVEFHFKRLA